MNPIRIFLLLNSHIDVGYTERQERIAVYQAVFIRQAVDCALSPRQAQRDEKSRFKFVAEGFWAIEQYLARYGEAGKQRLLAAIQSGNFELTGGYFHLTELLNYDNLAHTLDYAADFARENGLPPIRTAMSCDVNGFSWGFADALYDHGIRFLSVNINTHHGGAPFRKPLVPFWWQSPKGNRILVWNGFTYHRANILGMIPPVTLGGVSGIPGLADQVEPYVEIKNSDFAYTRIKEMIAACRKNGYTGDFIPLAGSSTYTDNSPVGDAHCELIADFNQKHGEEIVIEAVTLGELYDFLLKRGEEYPTYACDWNDWWSDGVLSTYNETRVFRNAQRNQRLLRRLDPAGQVVTPAEHERIQNDLIHYAEHTWGHSNSHSDPHNLIVTQLDLRKARFAVEADVLAGTALDRML